MSTNTGVTSGNSPSPAPDATPESSTGTTTDVKTPESSTGTPESKQDLLSVVMQVAPPNPKADDLDLPVVVSKGDEKTETPDGAKPEAPKAEDPSAQPEKADYKDPTEAELKNFGKEAQKRIRELIEQRNSFKTQLEPIQAQAAEYQKLEKYLTENEISGEDYNTLLGIGAALRKGDFKTFLDGIEPYVQLAKQATGQLLPEDLQAKVDQGLVPEDVARELVQSKTAAQLAADRAKADAEASEQAKLSQQTLAIKSAVTEWEKTTAAKDPDFEAKKIAVHRFVAAQIASSGRPDSPARALEIARKAYEEVNAVFGKANPPKPTDPRPSTGGGNGGSQMVAEPKTLMEAALLGLAKSR